MATTTTNLGLTKPATSDNVDVLQLNGNFDILDSAVNGLQGAIAIMANGNTHVAIASGQFVYVRKHSSLSEGLYTATAAIAANRALSNSNLTAVSGGGLNTVSQNITNMVARGLYNRYDSLDAFNSFLTSETSGRRSIATFGTSVTNFFLESNSASQAIVAKADNTTADMLVYSLGAEKAAMIRYTFTTSTITKRKYVVSPTMCESFAIAIDNTVIPDAAEESTCFYDSASSVVHLHIRILSRSGAIPAANSIVATVPEKYRPITTRRLGFCMVSGATSYQPPSIEGCYIGADGGIRMNNFVYGNKPVTLFYLNTSYSIR